jgi:hypothetical protein
MGLKVKGPEFRKVDLASPERGGLFGQASILAITTFFADVGGDRGKYILQNIRHPAATTAAGRTGWKKMVWARPPHCASRWRDTF